MRTSRPIKQERRFDLNMNGLVALANLAFPELLRGLSRHLAPEENIKIFNKVYHIAFYSQTSLKLAAGKFSFASFEEASSALAP